MDIRAPVSVLQGNGSATAVEVPAVAASVRNVLAEIASNPVLTDVERTALVAATATASRISDVSIAELALETVSTTGIYLRSTGGATSPRWQVLTALRAYGLNLSEQRHAEPRPNDAQLAAQVNAQLNTVVRASRGDSLDQVQAMAKAVQAAPQPVVTQAPRPVAKPAAENVQPAAAVNKLV